MKDDKLSSLSDELEREYKGRTKDEIYYTKLEILNQTEARKRMLNILYDDTSRAMKESIKVLNDQYTYRSLVRTLFAHVEGELSLMKQSILLWYRVKAINLTYDDLRKLVDEKSVIGDDPSIEIDPIHQPLKDNIKFTFEKFGMLPGRSTIEIDTNSEGWNSFCQSIKTRDNLMHPKVEENLIMTESGMEQVIQGWNWYKETSSKLLENNLVLPD